MGEAVRLQTLLHGGPYDLAMVVVQSVGGEWPEEIRVASGDGIETIPEKVEASVYRLIDVDVTHGLFFGSYQFSGMRESAGTLIQVWI